MFIVIKLRKIIIATLIFIFVLLLIVFNLNHIDALCNLVNKEVIMIDPGHGGRDPGALSSEGYLEKDINLNISKDLKVILEQNGYKVIMTRNDDISLHDESAKKKKYSDIINRIKLANDSNAKILISIHLNNFEQSKYYGAQVFYSTNDKKSKVLGETVQEQLRIDLNPYNNRKTKCADTLLLLKSVNIPAVIIECGFLSNPAEAELLNTREYQNKVAKAIYNGIIKYVNTTKNTTAR